MSEDKKKSVLDYVEQRIGRKLNAQHPITQIDKFNFKLVLLFG
jgi:hypothetical protein